VSVLANTLAFEQEHNPRSATGKEGGHMNNIIKLEEVLPGGIQP